MRNGSRGTSPALLTQMRVMRPPVLEEALDLWAGRHHDQGERYASRVEPIRPTDNQSDFGIKLLQPTVGNAVLYGLESHVSMVAHVTKEASRERRTREQ